MAYLVIEAEAKGFPTFGSGHMLANHQECENYVRGSTLRGALASIWPKEKLGDDKFLNLFCRGKCKFLGLFPVAVEHRQNFVVGDYFPYRMPLSMKTCKYNPEKGYAGHGYHDSSFDFFSYETKIDHCENCKGPLERVKGSDFYYFDYHHKVMQPIRVTKRLPIRHGGDRKTRRAKDEALYSYTEIEEGNRFLGWVIGKKDSIAEFFEILQKNELKVNTPSNGKLQFSLRVGKAKKKAKLECEMGIVESRFPQPAPSTLLFNKIFVKVVLQTPAIVKDHFFRPRTSLLPEDIFYGLDSISPQHFKLVREFVSLIQIDGWSGIHGLPKPPEFALAPGSTFVFMYTPQSLPSDDELKKAWENVQIRGIGERRIEGFGQILINPPTERRSHNMIIPIPLDEIKKKPLGINGGENLSYLLFELSGLSGIEDIKRHLNVLAAKRKECELQNIGKEEKKGIKPSELSNILEEIYEDFKQNAQEWISKRLSSLSSISSWSPDENQVWILFTVWLRIKAEELAEKAKKGD